MKCRFFGVFVSLLCIPVLLTACCCISLPKQPATEGGFTHIGDDFPEDATIIIGDENGIIGGGNGIIGQYPQEKPEEEETESTEPPEMLITLPDGTRVPEEDVQTLEDGTIVVLCHSHDEVYYHKCFFPDGSYAATDYYDETGECCNYENAARILVDWFDESGNPWRVEEYSVQADGELFLWQRLEYEYTQLEKGNEDSPWYHSATNELFYDESCGDYKTAREEYDSLHGSDCPIKCTYYDDSYSYHEYNLDGTKKKDSYYSAAGILLQQDFYDQGVMKSQYLFREDGSRWYETFYKDGVISSERFFSESGNYQSTTFYKNGVPSFEQGEYDDGTINSIYYDENGNRIKFLQNGPDGNLLWYALYENDADGNLIKATYYDAEGNITEVEEYD